MVDFGIAGYGSGDVIDARLAVSFVGVEAVANRSQIRADADASPSNL